MVWNCFMLCWVVHTYVRWVSLFKIAVHLIVFFLWHWSNAIYEDFLSSYVLRYSAFFSNVLFYVRIFVHPKEKKNFVHTRLQILVHPKRPAPLTASLGLWRSFVRCICLTFVPSCCETYPALLGEELGPPVWERPCPRGNGCRWWLRRRRQRPTTVESK